VSDTATISGENASKATGTVTYKIYTDSRCEGTAIEAGTVPVNEGKARASEEEVLKPAGTYYWQASYSGDEANEPSTSECGAEVETVLAPTCSKLEGQGTVGEGPELQKVSDKLSTNLLTPPKLQKFRLSWEHGRKAFVLRELEGATCRIGRKGRTFSGHGEGTLNGVPEYVVTFTIKITNEEEVIFTARVRNEKTRELVESFEKEELENSTEVIS
jgi:hypothetical protein